MTVARRYVAVRFDARTLLEDAPGAPEPELLICGKHDTSLMAGSGLNPLQLASLLGSLGLILAALVLPWDPLARALESSRILPAFRALAGRRNLAILFVGLVAFAGDAAVSWWKTPLPVVPDEFSYLLAADTFASGRLTNPTPAQWQRFETPEVLLRPTYQSKYPPGQGVFLAVGKRLTENPTVGVWLSSALACAALCWMLQAWVGEAWALYGALLATFELAWFGHWAQSFWGGMVAALGGALVFGAARRLAEEEGGAGRNGFWLALGLVILANTRPFEGLLGAAPVVAGLVAYRAQNRGGRRLLSKKGTLAAAVLLLGAFVTLAYNQRVTGSPGRLPYQVYEAQYDAVPSFAFQHLRPWPELQNASMRAAAVDTLAAWRWAHGFYRLAFITSKVFGLWQFGFGAALSLPFVVLTWAERWPNWIRILQAIVFAVVQVEAISLLLFWPSPRPLWIVTLLLALLVQAALLVHYFPEFWERVALWALGLVAVGLGLETWRFHSHYMAPVVPLALALAVKAIRRSAGWNWGHRAPGKVVAVGLPLVVLAVAAAGAAGSPGRLELWAQQRAAMEKHLESLPGRQLVIVHYGPGHDFYEEWVENRADLQAAPVIWAREESTKENCELMATYPGRSVWLLKADRDQLEKYTSDCSGDKKTPPSAPVLESLTEAER